MTTWSFDPENNSGVLSVEGDMTINFISVLKDRLLEAFDSAEQVTVDVSATTAVDVAGIQLLSACQRFSTGRGKKMSLLFGNNTQFTEFLDEVGFGQDFVCGIDTNK
ncbi:MAG: sulfate transporter [Deltaproteobacteria bacterium]|nr:MAG: sulfate transporter [Deltaproteobacteria bacterium]